MLKAQHMISFYTMSRASHETVDRYTEKAKPIVKNHDETDEENIFFPMAALLYHDFSLLGACGGHLSRKTGGIYIDITFSDYMLIMNAHATFEGEKQRLHQNRINHDISLVELRLILLLNEFYEGRKTQYENMLVLRRRDNGILRLQTMQNEIIDELASVDKRREWLITANKEFFDFGAFLFDNQPEELTEYLKK